MPILREDKDLKDALVECHNICVIGISPDPYKPSYFVSDVLKSRGFKLFLVNPNYAGRIILGERVYASIRDVPEEIDIVDVFRRPSAVPALAEEAKQKGFKVFWMQPGTESPEAIKRLDKEGYKVVAGRCAKIESTRLL
ncbi:Acetate--CoA ligase [ADP-forming] II [uncultured archaeon]|nr:Acetate--CoA ligase [ADP-forming] II [uncultured archaeon]